MQEVVYPPDVTLGPCRLILADCMDVLPTLAGVGAVIADPHYGIGRDRGMGGGGYDGFGEGVKRTPKAYAGDWDGERPTKAAFDAMLRAAEVVVIWGNYFADLLPANGKWLIWDKQQTMPSYSDAELAWTSITGTSVKMFRYNGSGLMAKEKERFHPTQKPVALMAWCMERAKVPLGACVLDPYMGSGTTGIACIRTGRRFIGIEKDPVHFQTACERIARELQQQTLDL
jgi:DNA modification methylase